MFFAVERLASHEIDTGTGILRLLGYRFLQALPTITVLVLAHIYGEELRERLTTLFNRYAVGEVKASWKTAAVFLIFVIG